MTFRLVFGALMAIGGVRSWQNGWIEKLYVEPSFFFKYYGFHWAEVPSEPWIYLLFALVIISAVGIMLGAAYRLSAIIFFLTFTYSQLLDATNYLNHYYLVCLLAFLLIFLPAGNKYSIDTFLKPAKRIDRVPAWCINIVIFQFCCVYFFAGLAKVNTEWMFRAMPMAVWLPERVDIPIIGHLFKIDIMPWLFSWAGMIYDLSIWLFLLNKKTRPFAYVFVVIFHVLTKILFNIGLFPVIMIFGTLIFFSEEIHKKVWDWLSVKLGFMPAETLVTQPLNAKRFVPVFLAIFCLFQVLFPLRHHFLYTGNILWTEEAYRFGWRVMLVEKSALATFYIQDSASSRKQEIVNGNYLTFYQEKQMAIQPDFILQFAHFLGKEYEEKHGFKSPIVTVESYVALNGRSSRQFIDPEADLMKIQDTFAPRSWVVAENF